MRELVRDLLPDIYKNEGKEGYHFDAAIGAEFFEKLREKLVEHAEKYRENWNIDDLVGVYDCVLAILKKQEIDANEFRKKGMEIRMKEGGYDFGTVIDWDKSEKKQRSIPARNEIYEHLNEHSIKLQTEGEGDENV